MADVSADAEIRRIVESAGSKHTFLRVAAYPPDVARNIVAGYYEQDDNGLQPLRGKNVSAYSVSWAQGAGSMVSTPADLVTWARALYQGTTLLPAKQKAELLRLISTVKRLDSVPRTSTCLLQALSSQCSRTVVRSKWTATCSSCSSRCMRRSENTRLARRKAIQKVRRQADALDELHFRAACTVSVPSGDEIYIFRHKGRFTVRAFEEVGHWVPFPESVIFLNRS
jgi:hypothetical protein